MGFPIEFDTVKSGWFIVYIEGSQVIISPKNIFLSQKINFALANSVDPDEMLHYAAFHLGLHSLLKYTFRGFCSLGDSGPQRVKDRFFLLICSKFGPN